MRESKWQLGVLRAMGMKKADIKNVTLIESTACIVASLIMGCLIGYFVQIMSTSIPVAIFEFDFYYGINFRMLSLLIFMSLFTVIVGTHLTTKRVNNLKITAILKGD